MAEPSRILRGQLASWAQWFLLLNLGLACGSPAQGQIRAEVQVDPQTVLHRIDPRIYGQFVEHYARVVYGGLWAELLKNRKFYPVDPDRTQVADPWKPETDRTHVSYVIDRDVTLDGVSAQRVFLFGDGRTRRGVSQTGFDVLGGKEYVAYAWIKADSANQSVSFRLESPQGEVAARAETALQSGDWQKCEVRLKPDRDLRPAVLRLAFDSPGTYRIGAASLMPVDNVEGMRRDVLELIKLMAPPIIRWPGGGFADSHDWRDAVGPRDRRPPRIIVPYGEPGGYDHGIEPGDFGTDEYLRFCELIGAEPYITVNSGSGSPEMAAAWVEYCNGPAALKWGARRAANGHPEPYHVKHWSVGNELWNPVEGAATTAEGYAAYFLAISRAMRAVDPNIRLTAVGDFDQVTALKEWNEALLVKVWEQVDLLSLHHYYPGGFWAPSLLNRPLETYRAAVAEPTQAEKKLRDVISAMDSIARGRKKIPVAFDEWSEWDWDYPRPAATPMLSPFSQFVDLLVKDGLESNQAHRDGLFDARMLHVLMRLGDRIAIGGRTYPTNALGAIRVDSTSAFMTAAGKMMQLYRQHSGASLVKVDSQAPTFDVPEEGWSGIPYLDATATLSADGRKLFLHLLNLHATEVMQARIQISGKGVLSRGDVWQIAPEDFLAKNDFEITNVDIQHSPRVGVGPDFLQTLPPHSATTLELTLK